MKLKTTRLVLTAACGLIGSSSFSHATTVIPVLNASFENPANGSYSQPVTSWTEIGSGWTSTINNGGPYGGLTGVTDSQFGDIDGGRVNTGLKQDLTGSTFTVGSSYTLSVDIGRRQDHTMPSTCTLRLALYDASNHLAAFTDITGSQVTAQGNAMATYSVNLAAVQGADIWAGQTIRIQFQNIASPDASPKDWALDNVRLTSVPEPSIFLLSGLGLLGLLRRRRS